MMKNNYERQKAGNRLFNGLGSILKRDARRCSCSRVLEIFYSKLGLAYTHPFTSHGCMLHQAQARPFLSESGDSRSLTRSFRAKHSAAEKSGRRAISIVTESEIAGWANFAHADFLLYHSLPSIV